MVRLSQKFVIALKTGERRQYKVAQAAGVNPTTLSKLVSGIEAVQENDARIIRVGRVLGLRLSDLFEPKG